MEKDTWETCSHSVCQYIPNLLWNLKFYYLGPILSHFDLAHILTPCFFKIYFNIIFQFVSNSPK
jgi:hypothetical protein